MAKQNKDESNSNAVALFGDKTDVVPEHLRTEAPAGNENVSAGDMATPRLDLLQLISPQCTPSNPGYVEGARAGLLYNSITGDLYENVNVMNLFFRKQYAVFKDRKLGKGFEGNFDTQAEAQAHIQTLDNPGDWRIVDTDQHYVLLIDENGERTTPAVIYMSGSKLSVSKQWNTDIQLKAPNADRFATVWNLSSVTQSSNNNSYENLSVKFMGWTTAELHEQAKEAYKGFMAEAQKSTAEDTAGEPEQKEAA